mmetsp:Transcript_16499/g.46532  ORF Transcript_16499/g.46532 Transcript_16499/m.46532 type:complete len:272 (+) Transcript_16499:309-1124(+)
MCPATNWLPAWLKATKSTLRSHSRKLRTSRSESAWRLRASLPRHPTAIRLNTTTRPILRPPAPLVSTTTTSSISAGKSEAFPRNLTMTWTTRISTCAPLLQSMDTTSWCRDITEATISTVKVKATPRPIVPRAWKRPFPRASLDSPRRLTLARPRPAVLPAAFPSTASRTTDATTSACGPGARAHGSTAAGTSRPYLPSRRTPPAWSTLLQCCRRMGGTVVPTHRFLAFRGTSSHSVSRNLAMSSSPTRSISTTSRARTPRCHSPRIIRPP